MAETQQEKHMKTMHNRINIKWFSRKFYTLFEATSAFYLSHTDRINFLHKYLTGDYKNTSSYQYLTTEGKKEYRYLCNKENLTDYYQYLCNLITEKAKKGEIYEPF